LLETSRLIGNGSRVRLNLDALAEKGTSYSLFPGQILGVRGNNPSGRLLNVSEFVYPPIPPSAFTEVAKLSEFYREKGEPIQVMLAAGPFTLPDSLEYEPFESILDEAHESNPHVLILMGPFVDSTHPMIVEGLCSYDPETLFRVKIADRIRSKLKPTTNVIFVPSTSDLLSEWPLLPQAPIGQTFKDAQTELMREKLGLNFSNMLVLPNPVTFLINECILTVSNTDTLLEMAGSETGRSFGSSLDRFSLFFQHLFQQRHLHPISPSSHRIHYDHGESLVMGIKPDILIIPSALKHNVKLVEDVVCVNPGKLCKGKVSGTYGRIIIHPLDVQEMAEAGEEEVANCVGSRARVELIKL
jgi:DNA polymerase alpha subunit B